VTPCDAQFIYWLETACLRVTYLVNADGKLWDRSLDETLLSFGDLSERKDLFNSFQLNKKKQSAIFRH